MAKMLKSEIFGKDDDSSYLEYSVPDDAGRILFGRTVEKYGSPDEWIVFRDPVLYRLLAENSKINEDYSPCAQPEKPKSKVWELDWSKPQTSRVKVVSSVRGAAEFLMDLCGVNEDKKDRN